MFEFSRQEKRIILFLLFCLLLGTGMDYLRESGSRLVKIAEVDPQLLKLDLNSADHQAMMKVKGIGAKIAGRILEYRKSCGAFHSLEELKKIKGITGKNYEGISAHFRIK